MASASRAQHRDLLLGEAARAGTGSRARRTRELLGRELHGAPPAGLLFAAGSRRRAARCGAPSPRRPVGVLLRGRARPPPARRRRSLEDRRVLAPDALADAGIGQHDAHRAHEMRPLVATVSSMAALPDSRADREWKATSAATSSPIGRIGASFAPRRARARASGAARRREQPRAHAPRGKPRRQPVERRAHLVEIAHARASSGRHHQPALACSTSRPRRFRTCSAWLTGWRETAAFGDRFLRQRAPGASVPSAIAAMRRSCTWSISAGCVSRGLITGCFPRRVGGV